MHLNNKFLKNLQNQTNQSEKKKALTSKNAIVLLNGEQKVVNALKSGIFPKGKLLKVEYFQKGNREKKLTRVLDRVGRVAKVSDRKQLRILTRKQMLQRLPIARAQVKADNKSENLLSGL